MSTRLTLIARLTAKPEHAEALGEGLRRLVAPTTAELGSPRFRATDRAGSIAKADASR